MKALLLLPFLCFLCSTVYGQQRPQLTQYMQNNYLANPAVAGIEEYGDARAGFRSQWTGLERAPTTFYMSIHAALNKNDRNVTPLRLQYQRAPLKSNSNRNNRFYRKPHHGAGAIAQVDKAGMIRASPPISIPKSAKSLQIKCLQAFLLSGNYQFIQFFAKKR